MNQLKTSGLNNYSRVLLHVPFILFFYFAVAYAEQRLFVDSGYYLFQVINKEFFHIEHGRIVLIFSQIMPLSGVVLQLNLKSIILLYSLGHVLFYYLLFNLCLHKNRDLGAAIAIILLQFIGLTESYFTPQFELYYGIGILVVFASELRISMFSTRSIIWLIFLELLILSSHPVAFYLFIFILGWDMIDRRKVNRIHLILLGILILMILVKYFTFSHYEAAKVAYHLDPGKMMGFLQQFTFDILRDAFLFLVKHYLDVVVLWIMAIVSLFFFRFKKKATLLFAFSLLYFTVILIIYRGFHAGRYNEQLYLPLAALGIFGFAFGITEKVKFRPALLLFVFLLIAYRAFLINNQGLELKKRTLQMEKVSAYAEKTLKTNKVLFNPGNIEKPYSHLGWSYPIESMLITGSRSKSVTLLSSDDFMETISESMPGDDEYVLRLGEIRPLGSLNSDYFKLDTGDYYTINSKGLLPDSIQTLKDSILIDYKMKYTYNKDQEIWLPIVIKNHSSEVLYSHPDSRLFLSYHWYGDGYMYKWEGIRTEIEVDIIGSYTQDIKIKMPGEDGTYWLSVDFILEGSGWMGIEKKWKLDIK